MIQLRQRARKEREGTSTKEHEMGKPDIVNVCDLKIAFFDFWRFPLSVWQGVIAYDSDNHFFFKSFCFIHFDPECL